MEPQFCAFALQVPQGICSASPFDISVWNHARPGVLGTYVRGILSLRLFSRHLAVWFLAAVFSCATFQGVHFGEHTCFLQVAFFDKVQDFASLVAIDDAAVPPFENLCLVK